MNTKTPSWHVRGLSVAVLAVLLAGTFTATAALRNLVRDQNRQLLLRGLGITLFPQQLGELCADDEGGRDFRLRAGVQILLEPLNRGWRFPASEAQIAGAIHQRGAMTGVERCAGVLDLAEDRLDRVFSLAVEDSPGIAFDDCRMKS